MDIAINKIVENLRYLAQNITDGRYGTDIDFAADAFLEDLQEYIVDGFGEEICKP